MSMKQLETCVWHSPFNVAVTHPAGPDSSSAHTTVSDYMLQHHTKWCTADTMLTTFKECQDAKAVLDPSVAPVKKENYKNAPKGCSRTGRKWYFNTHKTGALDGVSEPICKATAGRNS